MVTITYNLVFVNSSKRKAPRLSIYVLYLFDYRFPIRVFSSDVVIVF